MPPKKEHVFVVYGTTKDGVAAPFEAHHTNDNAKEAAEAHKSKGATDVAVKKLEVKTGVEAAAAKEKETKSPIKSPTKSKSYVVYARPKQLTCSLQNNTVSC